MSPIENIKGIVDNIEKSNNSKEEKEYAKKLLDSATKKGIETVALNADAKSQLDFLLKDMSIDSETATNQLADSLTPAPSTSTETTNTETTTPSEGDKNTSPEQSEADRALSEANRALKNAEKERGEGGWTNLYVMAKMISLGYIPKLHAINYHSSFKGQKIKYIWENAKYISVGGPLTNGTVNNELFRKGQEKANAFILKQVFNEEAQTKILLGQVRNSNISNMDRTNLNERLRNFANIRNAIHSGNLDNVRTAFAEYTRISGETPEKLRKQIYDKIKGVRAEQKEALNKSINEKTAKVKTNVEKGKRSSKEKITKSLDAEIKKIDAAIKASNDTEINRKTKLNKEIEVLNTEKASLEKQHNKSKGDLDVSHLQTELDDLKEEKNELKIEHDKAIGNIDLNDLNNEKEVLEKQVKNLEEEKKNTKSLEEKKILNNRIEKKEAEIKAKNKEITDARNSHNKSYETNKATLADKIKEKEKEIKAKNKEITDARNSHNKSYETNKDTLADKIEEKEKEIKDKTKDYKSVKNSDELKALNERKKLVLEMKTNIEKGNVKAFRNHLTSYNNLHSGNVIAGLKQKYIDFLSKDNNKIVKNKTDSIRQTETRKSKVDTRNKVLAARENVPQKEIDRINKEMRDIENKINQLRQKATHELTQLDNIAKNHPERVPELKKQAETLVEAHNREIVKLESLGVENVRGLNIEQLKGVAQDSKLLTRIANTNKWIDGKSSGVTGKVMGVGAILLVGKGVKNAFDKDGLSQETALNVADIGIGMIPVAGGVYDLYRASQGTDLNGKTMSSEERLMRTGFGIIGLVPGLGTVVKWAGRTGKLAKTAEGTSKIMKTGDILIEGGHLTGKGMSLGALGLSAVDSIPYPLPANSSK